MHLVTQGHVKMSKHTVHISHSDSYLSSIVTMAISCIVCEIKRGTGKTIAIFYNNPCGKAVANIFALLLQSSQIARLQCGAKYCGKIQHVSRVHQCCTQTDDRRNCDANSRA